MNKIRDMREGSVKVRIDGRGMERFFNIAAQREIEIWDIETEEREKKCGAERDRDRKNRDKRDPCCGI